MFFFRLYLNTQILITFLTYVLYPSSLAICNLVLLLYYFAHLYKLVFWLDMFVYLYLIEHDCHI